MKQHRIILYRAIAFILLILMTPFLLLIYIAVKITSKGPFIFAQKRLGKDKKPFMIYKIRTMIEGAELLRKKYLVMNEADGPVFKIKNDPRYTKIGRTISQIGLDEVPQLVNIIKGEMSFVGPRPLPVYEAVKVPKKYEKRFMVLPGITSDWVVGGSHNLSFNRWMRLDIKYVEKNNVIIDTVIAAKTVLLIFKLICKNFNLF